MKLALPVVAALFAAGIFVSPASADNILTFDTDASAIVTGNPVWNATGGNPGGYASVSGAGDIYIGGALKGDQSEYADDYILIDVMGDFSTPGEGIIIDIERTGPWAKATSTVEMTSGNHTTWASLMLDVAAEAWDFSDPNSTPPHDDIAWYLSDIAWFRLKAHPTAMDIDNVGFGIPEPASLILLGLGGVALLRRRR